ncbi:MAG: transketolase family protein, partial [Actinobacteria bacterium]|nr:transketolase family protein [Actinomycetota bacterium]
STPMDFDKDYEFKIGKANRISCSGKDVGIITSGIILSEVIKAVKKLEQQEIGIDLVEIPTLKPIDEEAIINMAKSVRNIITIEEHSIIGGLYSAVCEILCKEFPKKVYPIAVQDIFTESGLPSELMHKYGIDSEGIYEHIFKIINN